MNQFANAIRKDVNQTLTENLQPAYKSTDYSKVLDFFAVAGALRDRNERDIATKMQEAFDEDPLLAMKLLFFLSDIRGGLGERRTFRIALEWLAYTHPETVVANLHNIAHFNRWDSLFVLRGTPCSKAMVNLVSAQLQADLANAKKDEPISLLAKWMPSINTSSKETRELANWFVKQLALTPKAYRIALSFLRDKARVVETIMSDKRWNDITYEQVPSRAMTLYRRAFGKQDQERFSEYIDEVKTGTKKINSGTLYPYDIVEKMMNYYNVREDPVLEEQWKALPNYVEGENNFLIMADVSGSMHGRPIATSIGLALYFAERNQGAFHNLFMTFSGNPEFVKVQGHNLATRISNAMRAEWGMNTDLDRAFTSILDLSIRNRVSASDMPKALVIISDMEIDRCTAPNWDFLAKQKAKFAQYGYTLPNVVFWNVDSRKDTFLVDDNRPGVQLASGHSASTFKSVINGVGLTPYQAMVECLSDERYDRVVAIHVPGRGQISVGTSIAPITTEAPKKKAPSLEDIRTNRIKTIDELFNK